MQATYLLEDTGRDIRKGDGLVTLANIYGWTVSLSAQRRKARTTSTTQRTFEHVLDEDAALSNLLVDDELFIVRCHEENHGATVIGRRRMLEGCDVEIEEMAVDGSSQQGAYKGPSAYITFDARALRPSVSHKYQANLHRNRDGHVLVSCPGENAWAHA